MARRASLIYKLPAAFVAKHQAVLDGWDWATRPSMPLSETLPDEPGLADVVLQAEPGRGRTRAAGAAEMVVVVKSGSHMMALRTYADSLADTESG